MITIRTYIICILLQPPFKFDPAYKNPCWKEAGLLRYLPYFYLAGVKKSGSGDLWGHISKLPDVVTVKKELQWFAKRRFSKNYKYTGLVKYQGQYLRESKNSSRRKPILRNVLARGCPTSTDALHLLVM